MYFASWDTLREAGNLRLGKEKNVPSYLPHLMNRGTRVRSITGFGGANTLVPRGVTTGERVGLKSIGFCGSESVKVTPPSQLSTYWYQPRESCDARAGRNVGEFGRELPLKLKIDVAQWRWKKGTISEFEKPEGWEKWEIRTSESSMSRDCWLRLAKGQSAPTWELLQR